MRPVEQTTAFVLSGLAVAAALACATPAAKPGGPNGAPRQVESVYIADFSDDRRLVGAVEDVFIGRVGTQLGTKTLDELPETQFQVEVLENIKGGLKGQVVVNQQGGKDGDQLVLVDEDALLKPGQTYLFATRPSQEMGWHTLVPGYGDLPVADAQQRASLVARFKKATEQQVPYKPL